MAKDVIVVVNIDAKPKASEALNILVLSTAGVKDIKTYRSLEEVAADFPNSGDTEKTYRKVAALFNQGKTTLAETLIRKVKVGGIAAPTGSDAAAKAKALVEAVETLRETDDDWYILLTDQDGDDAVKELCAWAESTEPTEAELGAGEEDHRKFYFGQTSKVPYTDAGFALIASGVFAALNRATDLGIIATDPESGAGVFTVTVPKRADATDDEVRARKMPDIVWEAQLEGAVHSVKVKGTLRATLSA